jgi:multidrug resistance efflux pump
VADAPADLKAKEAAIAEARAALDPIVKTVSTAEATIADKTKGTRRADRSREEGRAESRRDWRRNSKGLNAEIAKRREFRATKQMGTPEYDDANAKVQELKPEIAQVQAAIEGAKSAKPNLETPEIKAAMAEIAKGEGRTSRYAAQCESRDRQGCGCRKNSGRRESER